MEPGIGFEPTTHALRMRRPPLQKGLEAVRRSAGHSSFMKITVKIVCHFRMVNGNSGNRKSDGTFGKYLEFYGLAEGSSKNC